MTARSHHEPALEAQIREVKERIGAYESRAAPVPDQPEEKGLVQLRKKTAEGIVPIQQVQTSAAE
jgi:hypothetical protein